MKRFLDPCYWALCLTFGTTVAEWLWKHQANDLMLQIGSHWINNNICWHTHCKPKRDQMILARNIMGWYGNHTGCPGYDDAREAAKFLLRLLFVPRFLIARKEGK